jgi:hypothetical protein
MEKGLLVKARDLLRNTAADAAKKGVMNENAAPRHTDRHSPGMQRGIRGSNSKRRLASSASRVSDIRIASTKWIVPSLLIAISFFRPAKRRDGNLAAPASRIKPNYATSQEVRSWRNTEVSGCDSEFPMVG